MDFHVGPVVKNLSANAGDTGLIPVHTTWATEAMFHSYWGLRSTDHSLQQEKPPQREAWAPQLESSPYLPPLEKALEQQWTHPVQPKIIKLKKEKSRGKLLGNGITFYILSFI